MSYAHTYELPVTVARCGNIYGGGDLNWSRIVPGTIRSLWRGERPIIRSNGLFTRDYIFVEDVVDAYLALAERVHGRRRAGRGVQLQSRDARHRCSKSRRAFSALMGREDLEPVILDQARGRDSRSVPRLDASAKQRLGWTARHTLDAGAGADDPPGTSAFSSRGSAATDAPAT